jgi:serine/threonine protein kinase
MNFPNSTDSSAPEIDQLGRYRLLAQLGQGGMGTIHLAVASGLGEFRKLLVVKELQRELARNPSFVEMFMAEAKLAARLNHPNIVQTLEAGEQDGRYFLSMEFLDGQPLTQLLKRAATEPVVSLGTRLAVLCDVLAGLEYAHELCDFDGTPFEIVHRDINPQNVFLTYHGQVKLVDFGIAKAVDVDTTTTAGVFKGKLGYAAPEQVRGEPVDARSDLFAVGVMLWELIAMRRFASGPVTQQTMDRRIFGGEQRILEVVPTVEPVLAEICDRALQVDRDARFSSAAEFRKTLERFLFVSGEAPAPLGALLTTKFDAERKEMHRVIDAFAKRDEQYRSVVRNLTASPSGESSPNSSDAPPSATAVPSTIDRADGATQVNSFHPANDSRFANPPPQELDSPAEWNGSLRGRRNVYPWIASAIALLVGSYVVWQSLTRPAATVPVAATAPSPPAAAPSPPAAALSPAPEPAAPAEVEPAPVAPEQTAAAAQVSPRTIGTTQATRATNAADARPTPSERTRRDESAEHPSASSTQPTAAATSSVPHTAAGAGATAPASSRPNEAKPDKGQAGQASTRTQIVIGQDLRELPKASRRPIDLEDPFR